MSYLESLHNNKLLFQFYHLFLPAASGGQLHILKWLKVHDYWPTEDELNYTDGIMLVMDEAICCAAKNGHKKVVKWLWNKNIDIEDALLGAAEGGHLKILQTYFRQLNNYSLEEIGELAAKGGHLKI